MKMKFKLNIPVCIIAVRSVFQKSNNYYPQVYLHECLMRMNIQMKMILIPLYK